MEDKSGLQIRIKELYLPKLAQAWIPFFLFSCRCDGWRKAFVGRPDAKGCSIVQTRDHAANTVLISFSLKFKYKMNLISCNTTELI